MAQQTGGPGAPRRSPNRRSHLQLDSAGAATVQDTVAAVFRQHAYGRTTTGPTSIMSRWLLRVMTWVASLFNAIDRSPAAKHLIVYGIVAVALLTIGRFVSSRILAGRRIRGAFHTPDAPRQGR